MTDPDTCSYPRCDCNIVWTGQGPRPPASRCPHLRKTYTEHELRAAERLAAELSSEPPRIRDELMAIQFIMMALHHTEPQQRADMIQAILHWYRAAWTVETLNAALKIAKSTTAKHGGDEDVSKLLAIDRLGAELATEANKQLNIIQNLFDLLEKRHKKGDPPTLPPRPIPYRATSERT